MKTVKVRIQVKDQSGSNVKKCLITAAGRKAVNIGNGFVLANSVIKVSEKAKYYAVCEIDIVTLQQTSNLAKAITNIGFFDQEYGLVFFDDPKFSLLYKTKLPMILRSLCEVQNMTGFDHIKNSCVVGDTNAAKKIKACDV